MNGNGGEQGRALSPLFTPIRHDRPLRDRLADFITRLIRNPLEIRGFPAIYRSCCIRESPYRERAGHDRYAGPASSCRCRGPAPVGDADGANRRGTGFRRHAGRRAAQDARQSGRGAAGRPRPCRRVAECHGGEPAGRVVRRFRLRRRCVCPGGGARRGCRLGAGRAAVELRSRDSRADQPFRRHRDLPVHRTARLAAGRADHRRHRAFAFVAAADRRGVGAAAGQ